VDAALEGNRGKLRGAGQSHLMAPGQLALVKGSSWPVKGRTWRSFLVTIPCDAADGSDSFVSRFPGSGDGIAEVEAFDRVREIAHEVPAAQFSIGEDLEAEFFLFGEDAPDVLVLELAQAFGVCAGLARLE